MSKVFKGQPRDLQSTRVTELYIALDGDEGTNVTIRMQGEYPNFRVHAEWNQPLPWTRPNFHRRLAVSTFATGRELDMRVRDAIWNTPVNNTELDYSCQSWVGDVGEFLVYAGAPYPLAASSHVLFISFLHLSEGVGVCYCQLVVLRAILLPRTLVLLWATNMC